MNSTFSDGKIIIRPWLGSDSQDLFDAAYESIESVYRWLPWCHPGYTIEESRNWITTRPMAWKNGEEYGFAILDAETKRFLGGVGINQINRIHNCGNLGYWVRATEQNHGIATRAALLLTLFGFRELNLERIEILAATGNIASQRVAEKTGALREGVLRHRLKIRDNYEDAVLFSLIRSQFPETPPD